jgi:hypothetical protein
VIAVILGLLKSPWFWRVVAVAAVLAGLYALWAHVDQRGYARAQAVYEAEINRLKSDAAATLAQETERVLLIEQALHQSKNNQDLEDDQNRQTIAGLSARLRALAGPAGSAAPAVRLRDPNFQAAQCGGSGDRPPGDPAAAAAAGAPDRAEAGGLLSEQLSELLQRLAREADDINAAYASCRADAYTVRQTQ